MRALAKAENNRVGREEGWFVKSNLSRKFVAAVEILDFVGREIEVALDRFGDFEEVVVLSGRIIFITGIDGAKKER